MLKVIAVFAMVIIGITFVIKLFVFFKAYKEFFKEEPKPEKKKGIRLFD